VFYVWSCCYAFLNYAQTFHKPLFVRVDCVSIVPECCFKALSCVADVHVGGVSVMVEEVL
jgi:hypothetical protein